MSGMLLNLILIVTLLAPFAVRRNHPPMASDDHRVLVFNPTAIVDIPVLDNDVDGDGDPLQVVALSVVEGGKAEIIDGRTVRVTIDWASYAVWPTRNTNAPGAPVAYGTHVISNGYARSVATWTVSYWPKANT